MRRLSVGLQPGGPSRCVQPDAGSSTGSGRTLARPLFFGVRAVLDLALAIERQAVLHELEAEFPGLLALAPLDDLIAEFRDIAAPQANHVIVVFAAFQLEDGMTALEMVADDESRRLELRQDAVDGGQTDFFATFHEPAINLFGGEVAIRAAFQHLEDLQAGQGDLQSGASQIFRLHFSDLWLFRYHPTLSFTVDPMPVKFIQLLNRLAVPVLALSVAGCGIVYRLPVRQGNVIQQSQLQELRLGMTPAQVRYVMGSPMATSPFDANRWDYLSYYKSPRGEISSRTVSLVFNDGKLAKMVGVDDLAAAQRAAAADAQALAQQREAARHELDRGSPAGSAAPPRNAGVGGPLIESRGASPD